MKPRGTFDSMHVGRQNACERNLLLHAVFACLGCIGFLHHTLFKAPTGLAEEERPNRPFSLMQTRVDHEVGKILSFPCQAAASSSHNPCGKPSQTNKTPCMSPNPTNHHSRDQTTCVRRFLHRFFRARSA